VTSRALAIALALLTAGAASLRAQSGTELLNRGVRATHDLEFDSAAVYLRRALAAPAPNALPDTSRSRALMYLGANELFRDKHDSAVAVFRRLIAADPRYRPDLLVFPPEVSTLFSETRLGIRATAAVVPGRTEIAGLGDRLPVRLYASSIHDIIVVVAHYFGGSGGTTLRTLYNGAIGDSLEITWDGRDSTGAPADSGSYVLRVSSKGADGRVARSVEVPLAISTVRHDTLPVPLAPADSLLKPELTSGHGGTKALAVGLGTAFAVSVLPSLVASGSDPSGARYMVAGTAAVAGIVGLLRARSPRPIPENVEANHQLRAAWLERANAARAENERRKAGARLVISAGTPHTVEGR
jgi:hypothetical protein